MGLFGGGGGGGGFSMPKVSTGSVSGIATPSKWGGNLGFSPGKWGGEQNSGGLLPKSIEVELNKYLGIMTGGMLGTTEEGGEEETPETFTPEDERTGVDPASSRFAQFQLRSQNEKGTKKGKSDLIIPRSTGLMIPE